MFLFKIQYNIDFNLHLKSFFWHARTKISFSKLYLGYSIRKDQMNNKYLIIG